MEIFGRSPYSHLTSFEWILLLAVLGGVVLTASMAADRATAALMLVAAVLFGSIHASVVIPMAIAAAGIVAFVYRGRTFQKDSPARAIREGSILAAIVLLYEIGRNATKGTLHDALINTRAVIDFERILHIDPEASLQQLVLDQDWLVRVANLLSSWLFLPFVAATFCWLYVAQEQTFRQFRTALGVSALLAFAVIALHPVIPPGFMPGSGLVDTHVMMGDAVRDTNRLGSLPSLHVGWVALSGAALFTATRSRVRWLWLIGPVSAMALVVMVTGQNYVVDWVVGLIISVGPFLAILWVDRRLGGPYYFALSMLAPRRVGAYLNAVAREIADVPRLRATVYSLGILLTYMVVRQVFDPGFTRYWGYMVAQIALTILIVIVLSVHFSKEGGFSILTHAIVIVTTYADTLGTAAHMYDRFISYDKFTHFFGCAAVASAMGDLLINMSRRGTIDWSPSKLLIVAVGLAVGAGMAWEIYEFIGDKLLDTGRHNGRVDTTYDLISDSIGAIVAACFLYWWHFMSPPEVAAKQQPVPAVSHNEDELNRLDLR